MQNPRLAETLFAIQSLVEAIAAKPTLTRKDLARRYNKSLSQIDRMRREGLFPKERYLCGFSYPFWSPAEILTNENSNPRMRKLLTRPERRRKTK